MSLFYVKNDEPFIPEKINPELVFLAKALVKTCRLTVKFQMKTTALNAALKSDDKEKMHSLIQKCFEKNAALYNQDMSLSGAELKEVDDGFFADKDIDFYKNQLQVLVDFACINCVVEAKLLPVMAAASEKKYGKKLEELLFFVNQ